MKRSSTTGLVDPSLPKKERQPDLSVKRCPECSCSYFIQVEISRFAQMHQVVLGQPVPPINLAKFYALRCVVCNELVEPNVVTAGRDTQRGAYDNFLDEIEAISAEREVEDETG